MTQQSTQEGDGYHELKNKTTIDEILETASAFEYTAFIFYTKLKGKVSKQLQPFVQTLADEEKRHFELFKYLTNYPQVVDYLKQKIETPPTDHCFSDYIQTPTLGQLHDDQSILQYALGREQVAMEQYITLAKETPAGPIRDLFRYLAYEELQHKQELEKRYYELVHKEEV